MGKFMRLNIHLSLILIGGALLGLGACAEQNSGAEPDMDSDQRNITIAEAMYTTLIGGDMEGALALMADDVQWTYYGGEGKIRFSGVYTGHEGIAQFFADYAAVAEPLGMQLDNFYSSGNTVFVTGIEKAKVVATGKTYAAPWVHVIKIEDGKIVSYEEYIDSAIVAAAFD